MSAPESSSVPLHGASATPGVSVLILTLNEALDLPGALQSVSWSDDIHILDSGSTDATARLAVQAGAQVHQHAFTGYAAQRNHGLRLPFRHPWLLILDADERPAPELSAEIQHIAASAPQQVSAYRVRRRDFLFGKWLKHAQLSPFYIRLLRPERARYTREINEVLEVEGPVGDLAGPLDHFPFSKGVSWWVERHNRYSTAEAELIVNQTGLREPSLRAALRDPDFHTRRLHQKAIFYKLPGRPLIKWVYMMVWRRALLDGPAGWTYSTLAAIYEYLIVVKTKELRLRREDPA